MELKSVQEMTDIKTFIKEHPYYIDLISKIDTTAQNKRILERYLTTDDSITNIGKDENLSISNCRGHINTAKRHFMMKIEEERKLKLTENL
jgi:predicted DNA-binding protein YlxM (UPF0122 family)